MIYLIATILLTVIFRCDATAKKPNCAAVLCPQVLCAPGYTPYTPEGECCTQCQPDCSQIMCAQISCENSYIPEGTCCQQCQPDCSTVLCPQILCATGSIPYTREGACCSTCILDCTLVDCAEPLCEQGKIPVTPDDQCCPICIDDTVKTVNCETCEDGFFDGCNEVECDATGAEITITDRDCTGQPLGDQYCITDCSNGAVCENIVCPQGIETYIPDGECCEQCDCRTVLCASCLLGQTQYMNYIPEDSCCPVCEIDCTFAQCPDFECEDGFEEVVADGQCCGTCQPIGKVVDCATCGTLSYNNGCLPCLCDENGNELGCDETIECFWEGIPSCTPDTTPEPVPECKDPVNMEFMSCGTTCPNICGQDTPMECAQVCVEECQCKNGLYYSLNEGICVEQSACPVDPCATDEILVNNECVGINCDNCKVYNDGCNTCTCWINDTGENTLPPGTYAMCTEMGCFSFGLASYINNQPRCTDCYDGYVLENGICVGDVDTNIEDNCPVTDLQFVPWEMKNINANNPGHDDVCYFCTYGDEFCVTMSDIATYFDDVNWKKDIKDCIRRYVAEILGCDRDLIKPRSDYAIQSCDCEGKFECPIAGSNGVNQIGFMMGIGFVMVVFGWM